MNSKKYFLIFNVIFFFKFIGSVYQSFYIYDPFHWGLAQKFFRAFSSSKPYKDFFLFIMVFSLYLNKFNYT